MNNIHMKPIERVSINRYETNIRAQHRQISVEAIFASNFLINKPSIVDCRGATAKLLVFLVLA